MLYLIKDNLIQALTVKVQLCVAFTVVKFSTFYIFYQANKSCGEDGAYAHFCDHCDGSDILTTPLEGVPRALEAQESFFIIIVLLIFK